MSVRPRPATAEECDRIWPAVKADRLMASAEELRAYRATGPWRIRVTDRGEASLLGRWKAHLDVMAIRGLWCSERSIAGFVADAASVARAQGFGRVMSPLVPERLLGPYLAAGMAPAQRIVAVQGSARAVAAAGRPLPPGVSIRAGTTADVPGLAGLDAECFDEFWRWTEIDLQGFVSAERLALAMTDDGQLIGYTLATVSRGAATLTRLATAPASRRQGLGSALLSEATSWAVRSGAETISLCTQEDNSASRKLYAEAGLREIDERYVFAIMDASREEEQR